MPSESQKIMALMEAMYHPNPLASNYLKLIEFVKKLTSSNIPESLLVEMSNWNGEQIECYPDPDYEDLCEIITESHEDGENSKSAEIALQARELLKEIGELNG